MKKVLKAILNLGVIGFGTMIERNLSVGITNEVALLQMQNIDFVPNLNATSSTTTYIIWGVILIITYLLWRNDIKTVLKQN